MRYLTILSGVVLGGALISTEAQASEDQGVDLGLRLGYAIPLGSVAESAGGTSADLNNLVDGVVPIWVDLGYRFNPNFMLGLYFQYGFGLLSDSSCPSPLSCS